MKHRPNPLATSLCLLGILMIPAHVIGNDSGFLEVDKRLLVKTEGRDDYKPRIVACNSSSIGVCLRDTRGEPANNSIERGADGKLRVTFASWGITYLIAPDGTGTTLQGEKVLGSFTWSLAPL